MYDVEEFSKKIKSLRVAYHLSLAEMANLLSMKSKSPLYAWEKGKAFPNLESLLGLNQYLELLWIGLLMFLFPVIPTVRLGKAKSVYSSI